MIVQAACRVIIPGIEDIQTIPLHRHGDIGKILMAFGFHPGECQILEQGFLDNFGNFYDRKSALKHVKDCGQQCLLGNFNADELYSEDLY